jgi:hypothetical protein
MDGGFMPYPYADITFTGNVQEAQAQNGSGALMEKMKSADRDFKPRSGRR